MCLTIYQSFHHKNASGHLEPLEAKEDILVNKILKESNILGDVYLTPFMETFVEFNNGIAKLKEEVLGYCDVTRISGRLVNMSPKVDKGIHAYASPTNYGTLFNNPYLLKEFMAVIPKGSLFYVGKGNDLFEPLQVVSTELIIFKDQYYFDKYYNTFLKRKALRFYDYFKKYLT